MNRPTPEQLQEIKERLKNNNDALGRFNRVREEAAGRYTKEFEECKAAFRQFDDYAPSDMQLLLNEIEALNESRQWWQQLKAPAGICTYSCCHEDATVKAQILTIHYLCKEHAELWGMPTDAKEETTDPA